MATRRKPGGNAGVAKRQRKNGLSPDKQKYAIARAQGKTKKDSLKAAGKTGARAEKGITDWEKDPAVLEAIAHYAEQEMTEKGVKGLISGMAQHRIPTRVITDGRGRVLRKEYDAHDAGKTIARIKGLLKEHHEHSGPDGGPIPATVQSATDAELKQILKDALQSLGGKP